MHSKRKPRAANRGTGLSLVQAFVWWGLFAVSATLPAIERKQLQFQLALPRKVCESPATMKSLVALLFPPLTLLVVLNWPGITLSHIPEFKALWQWPSQLWVVAVCGSVATVAGILDWRFHHHGGRRVPVAERKLEQQALLMGVPLFALLAGASISEEPAPLLLPIIGVIGYMGFLVFQDEVTFHQKCSAYETLLHRFLVGGNAMAAFAWLHWCYLGDFRHE